MRGVETGYTKKQEEIINVLPLLKNNIRVVSLEGTVLDVDRIEPVGTDSIRLTYGWGKVFLITHYGWVRYTSVPNIQVTKPKITLKEGVLILKRIQDQETALLQSTIVRLMYM